MGGTYPLRVLGDRHLLVDPELATLQLGPAHVLLEHLVRNLLVQVLEQLLLDDLLNPFKGRQRRLLPLAELPLAEGRHVQEVVPKLLNTVTGDGRDIKHFGKVDMPAVADEWNVGGGSRGVNGRAPNTSQTMQERTGQAPAPAWSAFAGPGIGRFCSRPTPPPSADSLVACGGL